MIWPRFLFRDLRRRSLSRTVCDGAAIGIGGTPGTTLTSFSTTSFTGILQTSAMAARTAWMSSSDISCAKANVTDAIGSPSFMFCNVHLFKSEKWRKPAHEATLRDMTTFQLTELPEFDFETAASLVDVEVDTIILTTSDEQQRALLMCLKPPGSHKLCIVYSPPRTGMVCIVGQYGARIAAVARAQDTESGGQGSQSVATRMMDHFKLVNELIFVDPVFGVQVQSTLSTQRMGDLLVSTGFIDYSTSAPLPEEWKCDSTLLSRLASCAQTNWASALYTRNAPRVHFGPMLIAFGLREEYLRHDIVAVCPQAVGGCLTGRGILTAATDKMVSGRVVNRLVVGPIVNSVDLKSTYKDAGMAAYTTAVFIECALQDDVVAPE